MNVAAAGLVPSSLIFGCLVILSLHDCNIDCYILVFNKLVAYCLLNSQTDSTEPLIEHNGFYGPKAEKGQEVYVAGDKADPYFRSLSANLLCYIVHFHTGKHRRSTLMKLVLCQYLGIK